jgi:hypothetical protein
MVTYSTQEFAAKLGLHQSRLTAFKRDGMPCVPGNSKRDGNAFDPVKCCEWAVAKGYKKLSVKILNAYPFLFKAGPVTEKPVEIPEKFEKAVEVQAKAASMDSLNYPPKFSDESTAPEPVVSVDLMNELDRLFERFVKDAKRVIKAYEVGTL